MEDVTEGGSVIRRACNGGRVTEGGSVIQRGCNS